MQTNITQNFNILPFISSNCKFSVKFENKNDENLACKGDLVNVRV